MSREFDIDPDADARMSALLASARRERLTLARRERREGDAALGITPAPRRRRPPARVPTDRLKPARFYRPPGFDPTRCGFEPDEVASVYFFLHIVRWKQIQWQADADGFSRLKWDYLERIIGRALLPKLRVKLVQNGVIEWDASSARGTKCQGFRIRSPYREQKWELITCADDALNRRIQTAYADGAVAPLAVHGWLTSKFEALDFDLTRALAIIPTLPVDPDFATTGTADEYRRLLGEQCRAVADRFHETSVCRYGRFHSPLTRLHRALRPALSVGGRPLVELDVANSQPLFLGLVAREYYRSGMARKRLLERTFDHPADVYRYDRRTEGNGRPCGNGGVEGYIRLCERGQFYESLMRAGDDRARFKTDLFREAFFGRNAAKGPRPARARFAAAHPAVAAVLRALKRTDYRRSAWVLQNAEATLVVDVICGRLMRERPDLTLFTIHDSFLVLPEDAVYVRSVVEDEFRNRGVEVLVRQKA